MTPSYTVTSRSGYGSRLGDSLKGIVWGFVLLIGAIILLGWNENNFVEQKAALEETEWATIETSADKIDTSLDKSAIYINWRTSSPDENPLVDDVFWVKSDDLKLMRRVEMYQWEEEEHTETHDEMGGGQTTETTYTYNKVWSENHIDSSNFYKSSQYVNPSWKYESETWVKDPIMLGAYILSDTFVKQLTEESKVNLADQEITAISWMQQNESQLYIGNDPANPEIWDLRITFYRVVPGNASAVGQQFQDTLRPYQTSNHRSIGLLEQDNVPVHEMFEHAHSANAMMTWILRALGFIMLWFGFKAIFGILEALAKVVPLFWDLVWAATGVVCFWLALIVWIVTIAIAWLAVRPVYGIVAIVLVVGIIAWMIYMKKKNPRPENLEEPKKEESHKKDSSEPEIIEA